MTHMNQKHGEQKSTVQGSGDYSFVVPAGQHTVGFSPTDTSMQVNVPEGGTVRVGMTLGWNCPQ